MTEKRFTTDNGSNEDVCLVDNITKKEYESNFEDIVDLMNKTWEQTLRFEKHNQELVQRSIKYEDKIDELKNENEDLKKENKRLYEDNIRVKQLITDFYNNERTAIGRSVIQQILEAI